MSLTLAPIWFPHCPAWMCTISLMMAESFFGQLKRIETERLTSGSVLRHWPSCRLLKQCRKSVTRSRHHRFIQKLFFLCYLLYSYRIEWFFSISLFNQYFFIQSFIEVNFDKNDDCQIDFRTHPLYVRHYCILCSCNDLAPTCDRILDKKHEQAPLFPLFIYLPQCVWVSAYPHLMTKVLFLEKKYS